MFEAPRSMLRDEAWKSWRNKACREVSIDEADLSMVLSTISSFGLIESVVVGIDEENGLWVNSRDPGDAGYYRITS